jgi:tetratricopeptide (TPR) repeat protein
MPLYPAVLSLVFDEDWDAFVDASAWFAILSSVAVLVGIGAVAYATLPVWPATALTLSAVVCVFIYKASFVQAELLYYGLLFACWLIFCRLLRRPDLRWAAAGGVLCGLTYLVKASGAAILAAFGVAALVKAMALARRAARTSQADGPRGTDAQWRRVLISAVVVILGFSAVAYTYLGNNKERFGRYFYNVNSTFFMWCDSWQQAKTFADTYRVSEGYPRLPPEQVPGPVNYWRSHTLGQMLQRLKYGFSTLGSLALRGPYFKYFALAAVFCIALAVRQRRRLHTLVVENWAVLLFCILSFAGYALAYAWYAQVAYGDRFVLSLFLPAMFSSLWLGWRLSAQEGHVRAFGGRVSALNLLAGALVVMLVVEGAYAATVASHRASKAFVQFYYNESRELQKAGNLQETTRGFEGVIRLDPDFTQAHHGLGMVALTTGRFDDAITSLTEAARLSPQSADVQNSLGSALIQAGRTEDAIRAFERAAELDPDLAVAWYNLGGSYIGQGRLDEAEAVRQRLETLDPRLADALGTLLED